MSFAEPEILQDFPRTDTPEAAALAEVRKAIEAQIGDEHVYTWPKVAGNVGYGIGFNHLYEERREIHGEITIVDDQINPITRKAGLLHWGSYNLASDQTRTRLSKSLAKKTQLKDEVAWENMLLYASFKTQEAYRQGLPEIDVSDHDPRPTRWGVKDFLLAGETNIILGDGGSFKSFVMDATAVAVACGHPIGPIEPLVEGPAFLADYETSEDEIASRCQRIAAAYGLRIPKGGIIYRQYWRRFTEEASLTRALVDRHKAVFVGVDSIGFALQGDETAEAAIPFFNALRSLGPDVMRVCISHVSAATVANKDGAGVERGSRMIRNSSRCSWEIVKDVPDRNGVIPLALYNRKINKGMEREPLYMTLQFNGDDGPVTFRRASQEEATQTVMTKAKFVDRIRMALRRGPLNAQDIAEEIGASVDRVQTELNAQNRRLVIPIKDHQNRSVWALMEREDAHVPPPSDDQWAPEDDSEAF
jgi:hypothetical protein